MPSLDWIGKQAVVGYHRRVPYRLLQCDRELSAGDPDAGNALVHGDNLEALKALMPYYAGQVKCVYIDPPYNTGNEGWIYNDNVNSPEISRWLGEVVGKEAEDLSRHDKWLSMMHPRLSLLKQLLSDDGIIFISIDDNEVEALREIMDSIFGRRARVGTLIWKSRHFTDTRPLSGISEDHEYILVYGRRAGLRVRGKDKNFAKYKNPDNDNRGPWTSCSLLGKATKEQRPNLHYDFDDPVKHTMFPCPERTGWICAPDTMLGYARDSRLLYPKKAGGRLRVKVFRHELKSEVMGLPSVIQEYSTSDGTESLRSILGEQLFSFPKPPELVRDLILQATGPDDLVLDSFAGSGTTGEAVLRANAADGGHRRFLLVELDKTVAERIAYRRLSTIITGKRPDGSEWKRDERELLDEEKITITALDNGPEINARLDAIRTEDHDKFDEYRKVIEDGHVRLYGIRRSIAEGLGAGFRFCRLGHQLFDENGSIATEVGFADLAAHVFFTETGSPIPKRARKDNPLLGVYQGRAIYLLYNGVLGDRHVDRGNVLTHTVAQELPAHPADTGPRVVFAEACRLGARALASYSITFRQIPFELRTS